MLAVLLAAASLGTLGWGSAWLLAPGRLPVTRLVVQGDLQQLDVGQVRAIAEDYVADGFFHVDVAALREALQRQPWVDEVTVWRVWPSTVQVQLTEQKAFARWNGDALLNERGEVFRPEHIDALPELPRLRGPEGSARRVADRFLRLAHEARGQGLYLAGLSMNRRGAWQARLGNGIELRLGRDEVEARMRRFLKVYDGSLRAVAGRVRTVDLRYTNGFAVSWKEETAKGLMEG
jgi:cell division protein FtsQ